MTRDEIICMAREAGFYFHDAGYAPILHAVAGEYSEACFERFASLVAEAEREACAKVCEDYGTSNTTKACAQAIRARSTR